MASTDDEETVRYTMRKRKFNRLSDRLSDYVKSRIVCGIYWVICTASVNAHGRFQSYVGASQHIYKRFTAGHNSTEGKRTPFAKAIAEHGPESFLFLLLEECLPSQLDALEKKHIEIQRSHTTQGTF